MKALRLAKIIIEKREVKPAENNNEILQEIASNHSIRGENGALQESCLGFF